MKKISRTQAYILTFLCYVSIHSLRTAYSFSKKSIEVQIFLGDPDGKFKISIVDSILLTMLGVGHFLHAVKPISRPVRSMWIGTMACALEYLLVPFLIKTLEIKSYALLIVLMGVNGFLQSYSWPMLLMIINQYFDKQKQSGLLGFWSANANVGNIVGFLLCNILIQQLNLSWEIGMYFVGFFVLTITIIIAVRIPELKKQPNDSDLKIDSQQKQEIKAASYNSRQKPLLKDVQNQNEEQNESQKASLFKILRQPKVIIVAVIFSLMKSVVYGILLWIPLYFEDINYSEYKAYIPISYDTAAIFGSLIIGYIFRQITFKGLLLTPIMGILVALFCLLKFISFSGIVYYFVIIAAVGFFLGGSFNTTAGLVTMQLTNMVPKAQQAQYLGFFAAIIMAFGNIITAATQILIGFVNNQSQKSGDQSQIFAIFLAYSGIALVNCIFLILRQFILRKRANKKGKHSLRKQGSISSISSIY